MKTTGSTQAINRTKKHKKYTSTIYKIDMKFQSEMHYKLCTRSNIVCYTI